MPALQRIATFTLPYGTTLDEAKNFAVTAGWGHAGQGGVTMPGKGKIIARDYTLAERNAGFQPAPEQGRQDGGGTSTLASKTDVAIFGMRCCTSARYAGKVGLFLTLAVKPTCFQRKSRKFTALAPLGERVARNRRFHQPGRDG
jgi:hypothetical protein